MKMLTENSLPILGQGFPPENYSQSMIFSLMLPMFDALSPDQQGDVRQAVADCHDPEVNGEDRYKALLLIGERVFPEV